MKRFPVAVIAFVLSSILIACEEQNASVAGPNIYRATIAGVEYCVPQEYFLFPDDPASEDLLLYATYPDMLPVEKHKIDRSRVSILIRPYSEGNLEKAASFYSKRYEIGKSAEFSLQKAIQNPNSHFFDLWLEPGVSLENSVVGRIECAQIQENLSIPYWPQCVHRFKYQTFAYRLDYDRSYLKEWQNIKQSTISLLKKLECR